MSPNVEIEQIPLDSLLTGSEKTVWEISTHSDGGTFPVWIIIGSAFLACILFSRKFFPFLSDSISNLFQPLQYDSRQQSFSSTLILLTTGIFCSCLISGTLCFMNLFPLSAFPYLTLVLISAIAVKTILLIAISTVSELSIFISFGRALILLLSAISYLAVIWDSIVFIFPSASGNHTLPYLIITLATCMILVYLYKVFVTLFSYRISPFYSFLYLCTLEIIPFCIIAVMLARL